MLYDQIVDYGQKGYGLDSKTLKMKKYRNGQKVTKQDLFSNSQQSFQQLSNSSNSCHD